MPPNELLVARALDAKIASPGGYVYAVVSYRFRALYIGQTVGYQGAFGRFAQHVSYGAGNTFRQRMCEIHNYDDIDIGPVEFAAVRLRPRKVFHDRSPDYREAVEAMVQYKLIEAISTHGLRFGVISRVALNGYSRLAYVKIEANHVASQLLSWLEGLSRTVGTAP